MNSKKLFICSLIFKLLPTTHCHKFKAKLLRWAGAKVGKNVEIFSSAKIYGTMNLIIGDGCFIGHDALIFGAGGTTIYIGDYSKISSRAIIVTGSHRFSPDGHCIAKEGASKDIYIGNGAVVLAGSIVLPGITIGQMALVAAGSVVSKNVEPYICVAGNPARPIKNMITNEKISR